MNRGAHLFALVATLAGGAGVVRAEGPASLPPGALAIAPPVTRPPAPKPVLRGVQKVAISSASDGRGIAVDFVAIVDAPTRFVASALEDVSHFGEWVPRLRAIEHLEVVDPTTRRFDTVMGLPWPIGDVRESVVARREDAGPVVRLRWDHEKGDMRRNDALWTLSPVGADRTEVRYEAHMWFNMWVPLFLFRIAESHYAPWFVVNLQHRADVLAAAAPPDLSPAIAADSDDDEDDDGDDADAEGDDTDEDAGQATAYGPPAAPPSRQPVPALPVR